MSRQYLVNISKYPPPDFALWPIAKFTSDTLDEMSDVTIESDDIICTNNEDAEAEPENTEAGGDVNDDANNSNMERLSLVCREKNRRTCVFPAI